MQFKIPFLKKTEIKSQSNIVSLFDFINNSSFLPTRWHQLSMLESFQFYNEVSTVSDAVDRIVDEFCNIIPRVWDDRKKEWILDHPIEQLFKNPSPMITRQEFLRDLAIDYLVTGNVFPVQTGPLSGPPFELGRINPMSLNIQTGIDGRPNEFRVNTFNGSISFIKTPVSTNQIDRLGPFRFVHNDIQEIWHIKTFNAARTDNGGTFFGNSKLTSIFYEIQQHIESAIHNWSMLKRGGKPLGALESEEDLSDEQYERLQKEINNNISGSQNAGRLLLLEKLKWVEMGMNNRDMDFKNLKKDIQNSIYNNYKVPLALVSSENMTMDNLKVSKLALYDDSVMPLIKFIYSELTRFTLKRYPGSEDLELRANPLEIPVLEGRAIDNTAKKASIGINTTNELRADIGRESLAGGDDILKPANLLPLQSDQFTQDNLTKPTPKSARKKFEELIVSHIDKKEAMEIASDNGLRT